MLKQKAGDPVRGIFYQERGANAKASTRLQLLLKPGLLLESNLLEVID